jgi:hypothetical protein
MKKSKSNPNSNHPPNTPPSMDPSGQIASLLTAITNADTVSEAGPLLEQWLLDPQSLQIFIDFLHRPTHLFHAAALAYLPQLIAHHANSSLPAVLGLLWGSFLKSTDPSQILSISSFFSILLHRSISLSLTTSSLLNSTRFALRPRAFMR